MLGVAAYFFGRVGVCASESRCGCQAVGSATCVSSVGVCIADGCGLWQRGWLLRVVYVV